MSWNVKFTPNAKQDLIFWFNNNEKTYQKIKRMIEEIKDNPLNLNVTGKPELLSGNLKGYISRRINKKDRLVYKPIKEDKIVKILQCRYHY